MEQALSIYNSLEIMSRLLEVLRPIIGTTGYIYEIRLNENNYVSPLFIEVELFDPYGKSVKSEIIDLNTSLDSFQQILRDLCRAVEIAVKADAEGLTFDEAKTAYWEEKRKLEEAGLPF